MIQGESPGRRATTALAPVDGQDDDALLARLRAGDEVAFQALVDRHRPWLVRFCTRLLGYDVHAAEDAAQESLLKLHTAARRDGRPLRVRPWLTVVARNTCVDEQRRRRPDLPGELPERAAPGDDPFHLDATLADAWPRLAGRHREVLYLREVLGLSYKEIGAVMGLTMPATETLVFRARAALRREYERSGGSGFGCGLFGFHLARLGLGRRREAAVADGISNAAVNDPGFSGLGARLAQFLSTSLPGCGEQAVAKVLAVAAGVVMVAASVLPGFGPFGDAPPASAAVVPTTRSDDTGSGVGSVAMSPAATRSVTLKTLLGNAVPADWTPRRARTEPAPTSVGQPSAAGAENRPRRVTPLRDAATATRPGDGPALNRPVARPSGTGPLRSVLPAPPEPVDTPERPAHPLRSLLADPVPLPVDPLPVDPRPADPLPADPVSEIPGTAPDPVGAVEETAGSAPEVVSAVEEGLPGSGFLPLG